MRDKSHILSTRPCAPSPPPPASSAVTAYNRVGHEGLWATNPHGAELPKNIVQVRLTTTGGLELPIPNGRPIEHGSGHRGACERDTRPHARSPRFTR